ncbi:MAG: MMPL family transporter [Cellvibrionales bacterium]|nr:MMPL family transporter [Cellvibrionales bacterium]
MKRSVITISEKITLFSYNHPWQVLLLALTLTLLMAGQMQYITVDVSNESYLPTDDPVRLDYHQTQQMFGSDAIAVIALQAKQGDIFTKEKFAYIETIHKAMDAVIHGEKVDSLYNARITHTDGDEILIEELADVFDAAMAEGNYKKIKPFVLSNPSYIDSLVNRDGTAVTINVKLIAYDPSGKALTDVEFSESAQEVLNIIEQHPQELFDIYISGRPVMTYKISKSIEDQIGLFSLLSFIAITLLLFIAFRRISGMVIPIVIIVFAFILTFSLIGLSGRPASATTQILPSLIIAFGVCDAIHLLSIYYKNFDKVQDKKLALTHSIRQCAFPLFMTTLTTSGGLLSFAIAEMPPIKNLGIFGAIAIFSAYLYTLLLAPALIRFFKIKPSANAYKVKPPLASKLPKKLVNIGLTYPKTVVSFSIILLSIALFGASFLTFSHDPIKWYAKEHPIRAEIEKVDDIMNGHLGVNIIFDSGKSEGIYAPKFLQKIAWVDNELQSFESQDISAGATQSLLELLSEMHSALTGNKDERFPDNAELVSQEILLIEMGSSEDLALFTDTDKRYVRLVYNLPMTDLMKSFLYLKALEKHIKANFRETYPIKISGTSALIGKAFSSLLVAMANSYLLAFVLVSLLILINCRSVKLGIFALFVNILPIALALSTLVIFNMPLNIFTLLVGSIMLGVVVDDSIHFIEHFMATKGQDIKERLRQTAESVGSSLAFTTLVLGAGFLVYAISDIKNVFVFGILCFITCLSALIADLVLFPALIYLTAKKER